MMPDVKEVLITSREIEEKVREIGARITEDYRDERPLLVKPKTKATKISFTGCAKFGSVQSYRWSSKSPIWLWGAEEGGHPVAAEDPVHVIKDFDAAWNAHDTEGVLALFADDAVVRIEPALPGEPEAYAGKEEIGDFVRRHMPGFHVESRDHQVAGHQEGVGDRVIWESLVSSDRFRDLGLDPAEGMAEAILKGSEIESFTFSVSQETLAKMRGAHDTT